MVGHGGEGQALTLFEAPGDAGLDRSGTQQYASCLYELT